MKGLKVVYNDVFVSKTFVPISTLSVNIPEHLGHSLLEHRLYCGVITIHTISF